MEGKTQQKEAIIKTVSGKASAQYNAEV